MRSETAERLLQRSGGQCEGMTEVGYTWTRCGRTPIQIHHMVRRSHGGVLLDEVGEIYHLSALCPTHHGLVHQGEGDGLLIEGNVYPGPVYVGPDEYLAETYKEDS